YWPRQTLIDATGKVRWEHAGEGDYDKMSEQIMLLLKEAGETVSNSAAKEQRPKKSLREIFGLGIETNKITPELYLGSLRSRGFGNSQNNNPSTRTRYNDPGDHEQDIPYLNGDWVQNPEFLAHPTTDPGYVLLKYSARNANAVLGSLTGKPLKVAV